MTEEKDEKLEQKLIQSFKKARTNLEAKGILPVENYKSFALSLMQSLPTKTQKNIILKSAKTDRELCLELADSLKKNLKILELSEESTKHILKEIGEKTFLIALQRFTEEEVKTICQKIPGSEGAALFKRFKSLNRVPKQKLSGAFYQFIRAMDPLI